MVRTSSKDLQSVAISSIRCRLNPWFARTSVGSSLCERRPDPFAVLPYLPTGPVNADACWRCPRRLRADHHGLLRSSLTLLSPLLRCHRLLPLTYARSPEGTRTIRNLAEIKNSRRQSILPKIKENPTQKASNMSSTGSE
jgi:hypothetical protein